VATDVAHRPSPWRWVILVGALAFVAFWTWALFFASKDPINRIDDAGWAARAEATCAAADAERLQLADFREMQDATAEMVRERADIVDAATDILERMLDDVVDPMPTDAKGRDLVPQWEADYRLHIQKRRDFTAELRATGENKAFYDAEVDGIPITERIEVFAADNRMASCAPPRDLTR
jgi:hypothetical protein